MGSRSLAASSSANGENRFTRATLAWNRYGPYLFAVFLSAFFLWTVFFGKGGLFEGDNATIWLTALPLSAIAIAASIVMRGTSKLYGGITLGLLALYTILVAISITWSLIPSATWLEFNRTISYLAMFASGIALARLWRKSWIPIIAAVALTVSVVVIYSLLTKIAPAWLASDETYARLRAPFNYWNAIGLTAAFGLLIFLWLGTEKRVHRLLRAAALPLMGLCLVALLLSYSRGSLLVAGIGVALWFILVAPRRLSSIPVLGVVAIITAPVIAWIFSKGALTNDNVELALRRDVGIELGVVLLVIIAALFGVALLLQWLDLNRPLSERARAGLGKSSLAIVAMIPVVVVIALATSEKGLTGTVESGWNSLTSEEAATPSNSPSRFSSTASVRSRYWREAVEIWGDHYYKGSGAGTFDVLRKRYRKSPAFVVHAHGQIPQAMADLGLAGALLIVFSGIAWLFAAYRTIDPRTSTRLQKWGPERQAIAALTILVTMFGLHAAIDWTWFVPGVVVPTLLIAGWVAGRGPLEEPDPAASHSSRLDWIARIGAAVMVVAIIGVSMWSVAQPKLAANKVDSSLESADEGRFQRAANEARSAHRINPTSVEPFFALSVAERGSGNLLGGLGPLKQAVRLQPANPVTWERLGSYYLFDVGRTKLALSVLQRAVFLDPFDESITQLFVKAEQALEVKREAKRREKERAKRLRRRLKKQREAQAALESSSQLTAEQSQGTAQQ